MSEQKLMKYQAIDGTNIELTVARVKSLIATGAAQDIPDGEVVKFMMLCRARQLNPYTKDAYMTAYKNKDGSTTTSVVVSKDYFVRVARTTATCDGWETGIVVWDRRKGELVRRDGSIYSQTNEELVGAWAKVYDKTRSIPCMVEVSLKEYDTGRSLWKTKPVTMLRKVALVQALRESYPQTFAGLYDTAEMDTHALDYTQAATLNDAPVYEVEEQLPDTQEQQEAQPEDEDIVF